MGTIKISGVILTPLKIITNPKGNVMHGIKRSDAGFAGFGEVYFSTINKNEIKNWRKHLRMTLNLVVPIGSIKFVLFDNRKNSSTFNNFYEIVLSSENYSRLTVPPNVWMSFQGIGNKINLLANIANLEHDSMEVEILEWHEIIYDWRITL